MEHTVKHRDGGVIEVNNYSPRKAIKLMCAECMGWEGGEKGTLAECVAACTSTQCPLYPHRGSFSPLRLSDEQREVLSKRISVRKPEED